MFLFMYVFLKVSFVLNISLAGSDYLLIHLLRNTFVYSLRNAKLLVCKSRWLISHAQLSFQSQSVNLLRRLTMAGVRRATEVRRAAEVLTGRRGLDGPPRS